MQEELIDDIEIPPVRRWKIWRGEKDNADFLCIVAARTSQAALKTARTMFALSRAAYATEETEHERKIASLRYSFKVASV
jgi:hypothetical protein